MFQVVAACNNPQKHLDNGLANKYCLINAFDFESNYASLVIRV